MTENCQPNLNKGGPDKGWLLVVGLMCSSAIVTSFCQPCWLGKLRGKLEEKSRKKELRVESEERRVQSEECRVQSEE